LHNRNNALNTWNEKLAEIWSLLARSPETFKGGAIWNVIVNMHGAVQAIGLGLPVLFFVIGVMKTLGSFAELKRPEVAVKVFVRFVLAKKAATCGLKLMMALFRIAQGLMSTIMGASDVGGGTFTVLPPEIIDAVESVGFFESMPLWAVTLIGGLFITVLSFIMIMSVYGRFFKLHLYTAIAPVPLAAYILPGNRRKASARTSSKATARSSYWPASSFRCSRQARPPRTRARRRSRWSGVMRPNSSLTCWFLWAR
jgi:hypothetical protein